MCVWVRCGCGGRGYGGRDACSLAFSRAMVGHTMKDKRWARRRGGYVTAHGVWLDLVHAWVEHSYRQLILGALSQATASA